MGSRKETRTRGFHSASAPFRQAYKRRASTTQQFRNWGRKTFTGEFNQSRYVKLFASIFLVLAIGGGVYLWAAQPSNGLFHSYTKSPSGPGGAHADPLQPLFYYCDQTPTGDLSQWSNNNGVGASPATFNIVKGVACGSSNIELIPTSTRSAVGIYTAQSVDLATASSHILLIQLVFKWVGAGNIPTWHMFLTTNKTAPGDVTSWDPRNFVTTVFAIQGAPGVNSFSSQVFIQTDQGVSITSTTNDQGSCGVGDSMFLCSQSFGNNTGIYEVNAYLRYDGTTSNKVVSSITLVQNGGCAGCFLNSTEYRLPPSFIQTQPLYWGVEADPTSNSKTLEFTDNIVPVNSDPTVGILNGLVAGIYTPPIVIQSAATPQAIDTGGFFGPVIKALITVGVFIAKQIINFLTFLYNLLAPLLAAAATIIGNVLVAIMNALGTIFGDSSLGSQISTAFSQIVGYLTNVFSSAVAIWGNILTALLNILNFVTQFLTITVSGGATLFNFIENFFSTLQNFWTVLVGVWNQFMKFYIAGTFTIQYILVVWWIWGMYENFKRGVKNGLIAGWLQPSETFLLALFKGGYWFLDEAYAFVVQLKQLIFGNRISPGTVAGNG